MIKAYTGYTQRVGRGLTMLQCSFRCHASVKYGGAHYKTWPTILSRCVGKMTLVTRGDILGPLSSLYYVVIEDQNQNTSHTSDMTRSIKYTFDT